MNKKIISIILSFAVIISVNASVIVEQKVSFEEAANSLAERSIINNHKNDPENYNLGDNVLRQEIAAVARWVSWLQKKWKCDNIFADLSSTNPNTWACINVEVLVDNNLISKNINFRPEDKITKAEALWMVIKAIWFDYEYHPESSKNWQQQIVEYSNEKWLVEKFVDYDTLATRWWIFLVADTTLRKEVEIKKQIEDQKYSDEVLLELENLYDVLGLWK